MGGFSWNSTDPHLDCRRSRDRPLGAPQHPRRPTELGGRCAADVCFVPTPNSRTAAKRREPGGIDLIAQAKMTKAMFEKQKRAPRHFVFEVQINEGHLGFSRRSARGRPSKRRHLMQARATMPFFPPNCGSPSSPLVGLVVRSPTRRCMAVWLWARFTARQLLLPQADQTGHSPSGPWEIASAGDLGPVPQPGCWRMVLVSHLAGTFNLQRTPAGACT